MKRAIPFFLTLAAAGPVACSSSGSGSGGAYVVLEPSQSPPSDPQEAALNPTGPAINANEPPLNPQQPPSACAPPTGFDACPTLCGNVDSRCAAQCTQTCTVYNLIIGLCPCELGAFFACVVNNNGFTCGDDGKLTPAPGLCTAEAEAALPCISRFTRQSSNDQTNRPPTRNPAPGPSGIPNGPPSFDGGL